MKRYIKIAIAAATLFGVMTSCQREELPVPGINDVPEGYRTIEFMAEVPQMNEVQTKAVDPDGGGVQNMTIFCFDNNGFFITTVSVKEEDIVRTDDLSGKFRANIPDHTAVVHLIGNQNLSYFNEGSYRGKYEVDIMHDLEASAGRMIYWARETVENIVNYTESAPLMLTRNQAKFTLEVADGAGFVENGWIVVNTNAFGTVAPYCPDHGFEAPHYLDRPFVTLPENTAKLGDFLDVRTNPEEYVFETENSADDPIDFIVRGSNNGEEEKYYRISIIDDAGEYIPVYRNHHYKVIIEGELSYGQATFADALEAPATNNVFVSISDDIREVTDGVNTLSVDETFVIIPEEEMPSQGTSYYLYYNASSTSSNPPAVEVSWLDGNNVALNNFSHDGNGTIAITLNELGDLSKREGTLLIKYGRLTRKIKVITIREQSFEPAWITTNIHGIEAGEKVTMMFTVSEDTPKELFPMEVLVTVNDLDVRNESGMKLPVITAIDDPDRYGEDNGIGYKYVLKVEEPGKQRLYLETILKHETVNGVPATVDVTIEAEHFAPLTKTATLHDDDVDTRILLHNLGSYVATLPADEVIHYLLVPQKINAVVDIPAHLGIVYDREPTGGYDAVIENQLGKTYVKYVDAGADDEFLFYSRNLDHNTSAANLDFDFYAVHEDEWSTGGRVYGFTKKNTSSEATFHLMTNTPKSAEIVRIASNPYGSESVTGGGTCTGNQYRSAIFELANFHPFHFDATINSDGTIVTGENEEVTDDILITYEPDQTVVLDFGISSFRSQMIGADGEVLPDSEQIDVDPFGTAFDVYIDAPMFELDPNQTLVTSGKLEEDPNVEGRFVYHADADESVENGYVKSISFLPKNIVSSGEVRITADPEVVIYYEKTFRINNSSIEGILQYNDGGVIRNVPANSFVPFEVLPTYNRIGVVTVHDDGKFEVRLRSEYKYDWNVDDIKLQFTDENGKTFETEYSSLDDLYNSLENGESIVLQPVA